jgi:hypothetical protein
MSVTPEQQKTLDFLHELSEDAYAEAKTGNTSLVNRLSKQSSGFQYYFVNVAQMKALSPEQFALQYPSLLNESEAFRLEYEKSLKADENAERLTRVEAGLEELKTLLKEAIAAKTIEPEKPAKKDKKTAVVETEDNIEADAESEA